MQSERDDPGRQLDFTRVSPQDILPIFDVETRISTIDAVLGQYEPLIAQGKSVAVACDFQWTGKDPDRVKEDAAATLVGLEKKMWDLAQLDGAHVSLPSMNFDVDERPAPTNSAKQTICRNRAAGLAMLYKRSGITMENAVFFVEQYPSFMPLLNAATKIHTAEKALLSGQTTLSALEMIEYLTIKKINATKAAALQRVMESINTVTRSMSTKIVTLQTRQTMLNRKMTSVVEPAEGSTHDVVASACELEPVSMPETHGSRKRRADHAADREVRDARFHSLAPGQAPGRMAPIPVPEAQSVQAETQADTAEREDAMCPPWIRSKRSTSIT